MITIYTPDHALHDAPHEFIEGRLTAPPHESPQRAELIRAAVERAGLGPLVPPRAFGAGPLRAVHADDYLAYLEHAYERWVAAGGSPAAVMPDTLPLRWMGRWLRRAPESPTAAPGYYTYDLSAPIVRGTYAAARASADLALTGAALLLEGQRAAYALCRPPGHHAGRDMCGGYCYLNNAAVAAAYLLQATNDDQRPAGTSAVAILDIDFHHGNGTQQIFYERSDVLFVSIHGDPARTYPYFAGFPEERGEGAGEGFNLNIVLPNGTDNPRYLDALDQALARIAQARPRFLVVSAGLDTFGGDPVAQMGQEASFALTADAYPAIGRRIAALGLPTLLVQEGGYATAALGENVVGLLRGFAGV